MYWQRGVLFFGERQTLGLLIAPLSKPRKRAWKAMLHQRGCHDKVHRCRANERAQPACDVGRPGPIVRRKQEEDRVVSP